MNQAAAKRYVLLALHSAGKAAEPAVLAEATSLPIDHVLWVLDRLRDRRARAMPGGARVRVVGSGVTVGLGAPGSTG